MKTQQPEFRAIPQFDSGRWKLRLERVPVDPHNETTIGMGFDSTRKPQYPRASELTNDHALTDIRGKILNF